MLKDLLKEGGLYTLANLLTKGVSLLLIPIYVSYFSKSDFGIVGMLGVFGGFVSAIVTFQLYQGTGRFIAEDVSIETKRKISSTSIIFTLFVFTVFLIFALLFKDTIIDLLSSTDARISDDIFVLSIISLSVNSIFYALGTQLKSLRKVNEFALTSFLHSIFNILLILFLVIKSNLGISSIFYAGITVAPLIILLQAYYLKDYLTFYIGKNELRKLLKFSTPLIPAAIAYLLLNLTDRFFIKEISMSANGVYEVAFKFSSVIGIVLVAFQSALAPILYQKHELKSTKLELVKIFKLFLGVGTLGVLILSLFSFETLIIFTNSGYYEAQYIMPLFYITLLITGLGMFSPGLHIKHKTKIIPIIVLVSATLNIGLNFILVDKFHLIGAAIATLISTLLNNILLFIISQKLYKTPYPIKLLLIIMSVLSLIIGFGYYLKTFENLTMFNAILIKLALIGGYLIMLFKLGLIKFNMLKKK